MAQKILIVGGGEIGQAIATLLEVREVAQVAIWDIDEKRRKGISSLEEHAGQVDCVFICVPSWNFKAAFDSIQDYITETTYVISVTKGIEPDTQSFMSEFLKKKLSQQKVACLGGPMLAEEIQKEVFSGATLGGDKEVYIFLNEVLTSSRFQLTYTPDIQGVAVLGVLKNVYTVFVGMLNMFTQASNIHGIAFSRIVEEMHTLAQELGGEVDTVRGFSGIGDFVATSTSSDSCNLTQGEHLIRHGKTNRQCEGIHSLPFLIERVKDREQYPLLDTLYRIINEHADAHTLMYEHFGIE